MAKQIVQFRYYGDNDARNYPKSLKRSQLTSGSIFSSYLPITQINIQTLANTKFYLNNGITSIIIGPTGIYKLNLEGLTEINKIIFDSNSLIEIQDSENGYLIIDIVGGK